jgi:crotonobetainyl-CoA:carnitine CoA-transferase CaiB-like acyl-CoA transferase
VFNDKQWQALRGVIGEAEWTGSPEFETLLGRKRCEDELEVLLAEWTRTRAAEELVAELQAIGVPAGVVQTARDVLDADRHLKERGFYVYLDHPEAGHNAYDGAPYRLSATPGGPRVPAPLLGQHNDYVLNELLGVGDDRAAELLIAQVVY